MRNVHFPLLIMTHVVAQNVITAIRMELSMLLMGSTCFKLRCSVCKRSEIKEEEEEEEEAGVVLFVFFKIKAQ